MITFQNDLTAQTKSINFQNIGNILHDLENPLTLAEFNLDILAEKLAKMKRVECQRILKPALRSIRQMSQMIINIKDNESFYPYSLEEEILKVLSLYQQKCLKQRISIKTNFTADQLFFHHQIEFISVLDNLVSNAMKACIRSNKYANSIYVQLSRASEKVTLVVRDDGIGLDYLELKALQEIDQSKINGMAIVYHNVENIFKGNIQILSQKHFGTEVRVVIGQ
ncbi:MAG: HAMP domain-containing sensor histidine kinase [bacterium]